MTFTAEIRDANLKRLGPLTDFESLVFTERWGDGGSWTLRAHEDSTAALLAAVPGAGICINDSRIATGLNPVHSGTLVKYRHTDTGQLDFVGIDDLALLGDRINILGSAGDASTVVADLITQNTGGARAIPNLAIASVDPAGSVHTHPAPANPETLLAAIKTIAHESNVRIEARQRGAGIDLTIGPSRYLNHVYSDASGNLEGWSTEAAGPAVTTLYNPTLDTYTPGGPPAQWPRRIERTSGEVTAGTVSLAAVPLEVDDFLYGRDFTCGDLVALDISGLRFPVPITEVVTTITPASVTRSVSLGPRIPTTEVDYLRRLSNGL